MSKQSPSSLLPSSDFDWRYWVERWERMQERYLVRRAERFGILIDLVRSLCVTAERPAPRVLFLGCGPGSLMEPLLDAIPQAHSIGVDFHPAMLLLARERLARFGVRPRAGARVHLIQADLQDPSWAEDVLLPLDAALSATALHWLRPEPLAALYRQVAMMLRPGGLLLNADHVGSEYPPLQRVWERHRTAMREREGYWDADDWDGWWEAYGRALGLERGAQERIDGWEGGIEEGLPLAWHLDRLRECGFRWVDCFWRMDCDAIYGGIKEGKCNR